MILNDWRLWWWEWNSYCFALFLLFLFHDGVFLYNKPKASLFIHKHRYHKYNVRNRKGNKRCDDIILMKWFIVGKYVKTFMQWKIYKSKHFHMFYGVIQCGHYVDYTIDCNTSKRFLNENLYGYLTE